MSAKKTVNVGLIGYQFMGKAHSNAYRQVNHFFPELPVEVHMHTICGRNEPKVKEAAHAYGWKHYETDWRKVVENPEIDVIDVAHRAGLLTDPTTHRGRLDSRRERRGSAPARCDGLRRRSAGWGGSRAARRSPRSGRRW